MNILAFDTATNACTAALQVGDQIFSRHKIAPREHASLLLPQIQALCDEASFDIAELNAIAFGCGPGSFMGVRLATGIAQGLAFGLNIPLIPISTLQIIAQTAFEKSAEKFILAGWDARIEEIYWGFYEIDHTDIAQPIINDQLGAPSGVDIVSFGHIGFTLAGNAWDVYQDQLPAPLSQAKQKFTDLYPEARAMLTIAKAKYLANEHVSPDAAHPHYIRHHVVHNHSQK
ncbi:MAG: tRNA (adenosine(37)-N6)-threonylcarbamoyltransferase complex dimerization subunit type 1 TsaB [Coxiellaceae bacterium]|nr:tRNA (adenosine(37)-N6)-threonylcarbamoyltransferase complex dimerization subunit type 1 TsaB [Coxiellaceae bacterium]